MFKESLPIAYDAPADLKKWPSLNSERRTDRPPYLVYNGTGGLHPAIAGQADPANLALRHRHRTAADLRPRDAVAGGRRGNRDAGFSEWEAPRNFKRSLDNLPRAQIRDRGGVIADRGQHLVGVGTEHGRHAIEPAAAMGEPESAAGKTQPAIGRVDFLQRLARCDLRMVDHFLDLPDA